MFVAMLFDGLDGRIARWTNTQSDFGKEYDSLCDMVAFGLAPAILVYQWGIERIADYGKFWGRFGWLAAFFFAVAAALRLARFNSRTAVPTSATSKACRVLPPPRRLRVSSGWRATSVSPACRARACVRDHIFIGILMVSKFSYWSGKELNTRGRIPWIYAAVIPLIYVIVSLEPGPCSALRPLRAVRRRLSWSWRKRMRRKRVAEPTSAPAANRFLW